MTGKDCVKQLKVVRMSAYSRNMLFSYAFLCFSYRFPLLSAIRCKPLSFAFLTAFCCLPLISYIHAYSGFGKEGVGTSGVQSLNIAVNARAVGMGEAYASVADGADALYWNPGALGRVRKASVSLMHTNYLENAFYDFAAYAQKLGSLGTIGLGVQYFSVSPIDQTDRQNTKVGTFSPYDMAAVFGWGRRMKIKGFEGEVNAGASVKFIRSRVTETAETWAGDLGFVWNPLEKLWLAVGLQNIGDSIQFIKEREEMPMNIKIGSSYRFTDTFLFAADGNFPKHNNPYVSTGIEYKKTIGSNLWIAIRGGFNPRNIKDINTLSSLLAGTGIGWRGTGIDFAWVPFGELGNIYRASLSLNF